MIEKRPVANLIGHLMLVLGIVIVAHLAFKPSACVKAAGFLMHGDAPLAEFVFQQS